MERASLTEISEWMVMNGVSPDKVYSDAATDRTFVDLPSGWRDLPVGDVASLAAQTPGTAFTDDAGTPLANDVVPTNVSEQYAAGGTRTPLAVDVPTVDESGISLGGVYEESVTNDPGYASPGPVDPNSGYLPYGYGSPSGFTSGFQAPLPQFAGGDMGSFGGGGGGPSGGGGGGSSFRQQVTVPSSGASAGPFGVRSPRDRSSMYSGGGYSGGGGGGGGASDAYWNLRNKLTGAFGGGSSYGGYGGYSYPSYGSYGSSSYPDAEWEDPYEEPDYEKNTGTSARYDEEALNETILSHPYAILPRYMNPGTVGYEWMRNMDAGAISELLGGTRGKTGKWMSQESVDPKTGAIDPRMLHQGKYTNNLGQMYKGMKRGKEMLDRDKLMHAWVTAKNKSYVGNQFSKGAKDIQSVESKYNYKTGETQYREGTVEKGVNVGDQLTAASRYLSAITSTGPSYTAMAYQTAVQNDIDKWAEGALKKKRASSLTKYLKKSGW